MQEGARNRLAGKDLTSAVNKRGADAVNSDEEPNAVLDEAQQQKFIEQMELIATQYVQNWRTMFAWLSLLVLYIHVFALLGLVPFTRNIIASWTPRSVTVQFLISPVNLLSAFFSSGALPLLLELITIACIAFIYSRSMQRVPSPDALHRFKRINRLIGLALAVLWPFMASKYIENWTWSKYIVIPLSACLLSLAADTFVSGQELTVKGLEKLVAFKYSHKKV